MLTPKTSNWFKINKELLPIKAHYFFLFGGMAGTVSFLPLVVKGLGFDATATGMIFTLIPFCVFLSKLLFGYITDLFRNIKLVMMILAFVTAAFIMLVLLAPPLDDKTPDIKVKALCINDSSQLIITANGPRSLCVREYLEETECYLISNECFYNQINKSILSMLTKTVFNNSYPFSNKSEDCNISFNRSLTSYSPMECDCLYSKYSYLKCLHIYALKNTDYSSVYLTYNFWLLLIILIFCGFGVSASFCLNDAACYEVLGEQKMLFGRQRLWGTVSWGLVTLVAGSLNDIATGDSPRTDYSSGFYIMLVFMAVDVMILYKLQLVKTKISKSIFKDVGKILASYKTASFAVAVYVCGALMGLIWNYQFWYLQDLGASQTLIGLVLAVQCLAAEVPVFFISGWIIEKFGYFTCMLIVFLAFALRIGLYVILEDPWMTLPIEVLHGLTFALTFASLTSYAANAAYPGTEVTTLGVLEGLFEGLGVATGSLLGGIGFDRFGGKMTFFIASMISLASIPTLAINYIIIKRISDGRETKLMKSTDHTREYGTDDFAEIHGIKLHRPANFNFLNVF